MNSKVVNNVSTIGMKVDKKIRVAFPKMGSGSKGKWQYFIYTESKKDETGDYKKVRQYKIWVANPMDDLADGDYVKIKSILSFYEKFTTYDDGRKFLEINVTCEIAKNEVSRNNEFMGANLNENTFNPEDFNVNIDDLNFGL